MKQLQLIGIIAMALLLFGSCSKKSASTNSTGHLIGVQDRPDWDNINPHGMVYIPSGTFRVGGSDQDVNSTFFQPTKAKSVQGFYMDDTEITNNEYREFIHYVRDSTAHSMLEHYEEDDNGNQRIDWTYDVDWASDGEDGDMLKNKGMFHSGDDVFGNKREIDVSQLKFKYDRYNWSAAAGRTGRDQARSSYIIENEVNIYPDTLAWIHDFSYSYNEPMTRNYFWHPAFDDYPVVGVNWEQADAFCSWRTLLWNEHATETGETMGEEFRLPFEGEWEYAARGGLDSAPYPWGGPYVRNRKGCLLANFKPGRGNYMEDGGIYTVKADAYHPNDYGLYNMSGNVSEWTSTAFYEAAYSFDHDLNPDIRYHVRDEDPPTMRRKVIRGGSWKDIAYYLQTGTRHWEYMDTSKSYVGFRCALTFLGRSMNDQN